VNVSVGSKWVVKIKVYGKGLLAQTRRGCGQHYHRAVLFQTFNVGIDPSGLRG